VRIAVVVFDGLAWGTLSFALSVFDLAAKYRALPDIDLRIVAAEPSAELRCGGITMDVPYDLDLVRAADLVIVTDCPDPATQPPEELLDTLRAAHARGARVAGLCLGAFVLAAAGLLDGRPATTHWKHAAQLASAYPQVRVEPSVLYVDDGDVLTAGGGAAGIDLGLHLVRAADGAAAANRIARYMVVAPHRPGGQAQYIESPVPEIDAGDPVGATMEWALQRLDQALPVVTLAHQAGMSRRNYDRRFREITGLTPVEWLNHQRVLRARQLLESTQLSVDQVARQCGFATAAGLRPPFRRLVGVPPGAYRRTFSQLS
jgi:transcriptional regulator GlxA family with amidase domain